MTDRERILTNIAALLAEEVCRLQRIPAVREQLANPRCLGHIRVEDPYERPAFKKGDLVLCQTSTGLQQNPFLVSFVEADGNKNDPRGLVLRAIGTNQLCDYSNENFCKITGIQGRFLFEGAQREFSVKLHKALRKIGSYNHRFREVSFPEDWVAEVRIGEPFGGLNKPTKDYLIRIPFTKRMAIKAIVAQLVEQGYGTREFELIEAEK
jgi:hypothetical protein